MACTGRLPDDTSLVSKFLRECAAGHAPGYDITVYARPAAWLGLANALDAPFAQHVGAVCRGDWLLGTACQRCRRCLETASHAIASLRKDAEMIDKVRCVITRGGYGFDFSDRFKLEQYAEARRILWEDD